MNWIIYDAKKNRKWLLDNAHFSFMQTMTLLFTTKVLEEYRKPVERRIVCLKEECFCFMIWDTPINENETIKPKYSNEKANTSER